MTESVFLLHLFAVRPHWWQRHSAGDRGGAAAAGNVPTMMPEHVAVLVNPRAGGGRSATVGRRVIDVLRSRGLAPQVLLGRTAGEAVDLVATAVHSGVDTLLVCGTSVSGCVRATVTDAFMRDIRCMVVREAVADRTPAVMEANLFDMEQKYADVVALGEAMDYLNSFALKN